MERLKLTLTKEWFDLILEGKKTFEYREYKKHWIQRLQTKNKETGFYGGTRNYKYIEFTNGYGNHRPWMLIEFIGVSIMKGVDIKPDNNEGIDPKKDYFVIGLGELISTDRIIPKCA